ncbi:low molecular weight protein-tyrosine-phosphatase [Roseibium sp. RKSG952]|uniref:low molecular weight protein-tyrosine-phosphatase n=1 Tax=Roseibium sp. RKSG952 TaxID=2529384 RepID=UPI0012BCB7B3|nr:low molecular weight protein-tyrosine-phosphatase [Roseibium sp. RKSG952]MTH98215.1 low molecular weight phosphotyrosine protein phosphatase [Roseibium sp. RKSG952]
MTTKAILFVCLGNICRSPLAEGIFRRRAEERGQTDTYRFDSAGTGAWHVGNPPDPRSIAIARHHGIDISGQRARQVVEADFKRFDLILAMDRSNLETLSGRMPATGTAQVQLLLDHPPQDVPDPYYGGPQGFEQVYQMLCQQAERLIS